MKKAIFTLAIASFYLVSCNNGTTNDHGHDHPHGEHGEHGDHDHHEGDHDHDHHEQHHQQEEFVVGSDSTSTQE